jgi:ElaB/YqjD/DUF883 family membrane-anchored ribosome-binding protein
MDERAAEIVKDISEERQRLGDSIAALEHKVREASDWRVYFARKPWVLLGAAFGAGFLLPRLFIWKSR